MDFKMRTAAVAVTIALAGGLVTVPADVSRAQGLFDRLFGGPSFRDPVWDRQQNMRERRYREREREGRRDFRDFYDDPEPVAKVSSPKYYTYKPDTFANASFEKLAQIRLASVDENAVPSTPFTRAAGHLADFRIRTLPEVADAIRAYYLDHRDFLWVTDGAVNDRARAVIAVMQRADEVGLEPADYALELPDLTNAPAVAALAPSEPATETDAIAPEDGDTIAKVSAVLDAANADARDAALIRFEIALSARMLTYALDAGRGRIDPNRISGYHDIPRKAVDLVAMLDAANRADDIGQWLERRNPTNAAFNALKARLASLRSETEGNRVEIAEGTLLKPGVQNPEVANVVAAIRLRGSDELRAAHAETLAAYVGGEDYTPELVELVLGFQAEAGLKPDGIVGRNTINALVEDSLATRIDKVVLAMERLRWLPNFFGAQNVFVNQAAFTATYSEAGREPLSMRVVVGQKSNQTSFFVDQIETVEYNPYWGVPYSIIVNEMIPELRQDPSYLDRLGYEVTTNSGRQVSSASVDWYGVASKQVPINVRQPPGPKNALGELKILFPNKHAIYMHDTPAKSLFDKDSRAFSHGCIRLHDPQAMAAAVLGKSVDYVRGRIAEGHNDSDPVTRKIPVYVAYFTAWPTAEGEVKFYDDVYDRDMYLERAIERTREARATS